MPRRKFNFGAQSHSVAPGAKGGPQKGNPSRRYDLDPLESLSRDKRANKNSEPARGTIATPETFDLENEDGAQGNVSSDSVTFDAPTEVDGIKASQTRQGLPDELSDQITKEQAELDKLRQELGAQGSEVAADPDPFP